MTRDVSNRTPVMRTPRAPNAEIDSMRPTRITELICFTFTVVVWDAPFVPVTVRATVFECPDTDVDVLCLIGRLAGAVVGGGAELPGFAWLGGAGVDPDPEPLDDGFGFDDEPTFNLASTFTPFRSRPAIPTTALT